MAVATPELDDPTHRITDEGCVKMRGIILESFPRFGRDRAKNGAGPVTLGAYIGAISWLSPCRGCSWRGDHG